MLPYVGGVEQSRRQGGKGTGLKLHGKIETQPEWAVGWQWPENSKSAYYVIIDLSYYIDTQQVWLL